MPDTPTFVVNDRRKFTSEGELRHDVPSPASTPAATNDTSAADSFRGPQLVSGDAAPVTPATSELADLPEAGAISDLYPDHTEPAGTASENRLAADIDAGSDLFQDDAALPAGPTEEQAGEAARAYAATVDRLDTAMRAANPGGDRMPEMTFERLVQSLYTQALLLLGGAAEPGETPRVDILGARQTIDMLGVVAAKAKGNLAAPEQKLLDSALFDLHMGFLEITQALARQAAQRQTGAGPAGGPGGGTPPFGGGAPPFGGGAGGPRIVR